MTQTARPFRSVLYIPGSKERALEKAMGLPADAIVVLRSVRAPWSALQPDSHTDVLGAKLRQAARPAWGAPLGTGCDAVWFADEAELLACLAEPLEDCVLLWDGVLARVEHRRSGRRRDCLCRFSAGGDICHAIAGTSDLLRQTHFRQAGRYYHP